MRVSILKLTISFLTLIVTFLLYGTALAQSGADPAILTDGLGEYPLGLHLEILEDPSGGLTIEQVSSPAFASQFVPSQVDVPNLGYTDNAIWVRFEVKNETSVTEQWLLEVAFANIHFIDLYAPNPEGTGFVVKQTGILRPPETRDILHPHFVFDLTVPSQIEQTVYLRIQSGASITLPITLWEPTTFINESQWDLILQVVIFGGLLSLLIYNLFLLFSLREESYLYLVISLASIIVFDLAYTGYLEVYILPDFYYLRHYYIALSFSLVFISIILFSDTFLELKVLLPKLHRLNIVMLAAWGVLILLIPFTSYQVIAVFMVVWALPTLAAILAAGIVARLRGYHPARYFLIAWFGLIITFFLVLLVRLGFASSTAFSENAYRLGWVWMAVCWSFALADRINLLKAETETANRDLQHSEQRLSQILEGLPLGVVVYGIDQKPSFMNQRTSEILSNPEQKHPGGYFAWTHIGTSDELFLVSGRRQQSRIPFGTHASIYCIAW